MPGNPWKPGKPIRPTEPLRVIFLSLFLAILLQIPLSALNSKATPSNTVILSPNPRPSPANRAVHQQTFQPTSIPHYAFIKYSTYRFSLNSFFVVGISSKVPLDRDDRQVVHTCEWHPSRSTAKEPVVANASMLYIEFDENGMTYVPAIVNCTFGEDVGVDGNGGTLVIRVSLTYHRYEKNVPAVVFEEHKGEVEVFTSPPKQKPHKYAFCGPPMHTHVKADWIKAWMVYHNYIWNGDALFFFYNVGGLRDEDRHLFQDFLDAGLLIITDHSGDHFDRLYPSWYYHQLLFIEDCLFRARALADYVFFFDFDEFLQIPPPETIESLLRKHKERPWVTVGNIPADFTHCTSPNRHLQTYPVERMLWHDKRPECTHADQDPWLCIAAPGRRKWIANTRYTLLGGVHRAAVPHDGGVDVNASEARVIHFHGVLGVEERGLCREVVVTEGELNAPLERDEGIARVFGAAKAFRVGRNDRGMM